MNEWTISRLRRRGGALVAVFAVIAAVWATLGTSTAAGKQKLALSPQVALDWNSYAVAAVRSATTMNGVPAGSPPRGRSIRWKASSTWGTYRQPSTTRS